MTPDGEIKFGWLTLNESGSCVATAVVKYKILILYLERIGLNSDQTILIYTQK
jgi:hypothetical protein